ncbi:D-alanyl-D-alanine-carboxypeptidase/endopeptidase AmpH precursor [Botrimarina colliarenosi]|uniref:D-alanyl-D-alanine-carboxypeptidase/endopeptidase AmpH n=1 Tax=Botrimarina colliarenosi TaxID=2528001 RepID=A0A5C6A219_9BACT|nr:serine hydrolase domain-containing protein [Botrimarina colliarenosi]TWT93455.1 D-alanyl-D-alanine-carboxypeptidase/endopeptidase AmpH precursor [Botrimarina colliarenosi]
MTRPLSTLCLLLAATSTQAEIAVERLAPIADRVAESLAAGEFAGCVVAIGTGDGVAYLEAFGNRQVVPEHHAMTTDTVFDMASLTKPVATATSIMVLVERGQVRLRDSINKYLPEIDGAHGEQITVESLLTHQSGYVPDNSIKDYQHGVDEAWRRLFGLTPQHPPGSRFQYSDVNFELLGKIVERAGGKPLNEFARDEVYRPLGMTETGYLPPAELAARAAASEPRDGKMLVGEVHDPRAALLDGVAGHAGLFSTAEDLALYARMMLHGGELNGVRVLGAATVAEMTRPRNVPGDQLRAAGWDMASGYSSNRGETMTPRAFGHGGFTGTAMWIDPGLDLYVIFLSNRLHPDGKGNANETAGRVGAIAAGAVVGAIE